MTQEEKELLLKDLCARLPYGVICEVEFKDSEGWKQMDMILSGSFENECYFTTESGSAYSREFKPYLRPMSSMTEEENEEWNSYVAVPDGKSLRRTPYCIKYIDWLLEHHFDYRGLIKKGIALEAPENMYNTRTE